MSGLTKQLENMGVGDRQKSYYVEKAFHINLTIRLVCVCVCVCVCEGLCVCVSAIGSKDHMWHWYSCFVTRLVCTGITLEILSFSVRYKPNAQKGNIYGLILKTEIYVNII